MWKRRYPSGNTHGSPTPVATAGEPTGCSMGLAPAAIPAISRSSKASASRGTIMLPMIFPRHARSVFRLRPDPAERSLGRLPAGPEASASSGLLRRASSSGMAQAPILGGDPEGHGFPRGSMGSHRSGGAMDQGSRALRHLRVHDRSAELASRPRGAVIPRRPSLVGQRAGGASPVQPVERRASLDGMNSDGSQIL